LTLEQLTECYIDKFYEDKDNINRINDLDVFAIYMCFDEIVYENCVNSHRNTRQYYDEQNEIYIALWCAGFYDQNNYAPSITEVRKHEFYSDIDFMKLLLRGYDLKNELGLDLNRMFKGYYKDNGERLFANDTKYTFLRKNDINIIKNEDPKALETFTNI
jgi:hypothetical protein